MTIDKPENFYASYPAFKRYETPVIKAKHARWYDCEFWHPARCTREMSVLELGSGRGEFLAYLARKGVVRLLGIEMDLDAVAVMPADLKYRVHIGDIWEYLAGTTGERWDRVVMLDVLEHFTSAEGVRLLEEIKRILAPGGLVVARVPNMGSPWGGIHQYGDLTHKAAYAANGLKQLGLAAGYDVERFVAQERGSPIRRLLERCVHGLLGQALTVTPVVWSANIIVIYRLRSA